MDTRLIKLLLLRLRGGIRQRLQELMTLKRLLLLLMLTLLLVLLFKSSLFAASHPVTDWGNTNSHLFKTQIAQFMPVSLLAGFLLTILIAPGPGLYFSPTEMNLLFSAPFTRRALLIYKLACYVFGVLLSSLLITVLTPSTVLKPLANFSGTFFSLLFIQLLTVVSGLVIQPFKKAVGYDLKFRYLIIALFILIAGIIAYQAMIAESLKGALLYFQTSLVGLLLLSPFEVLTHIFLAQSFFLEVLGWSAIALTMNFALIVLVILLDGQSFEATTAANFTRHQHWERMRRSGLLWAANPIIVSHFIPPMFGDIGAVAWRQLLSALRSSKKVLVVFLGVAILSGPLLVAASADISKWSLMGGVFFAAVFVLPRVLVFDFRSDLETMETLKVLPLAAWKISLGQLITPILLTCLIELLLLSSTAIAADTQWRIYFLSVSPFLLPFNLLLYSLENLFFLLFPAPLVPIGRADFDFLGRTLLEFTIKSAILIASYFLAALVAQFTITKLGWTWLGFVSVAWGVLMLIAVLVLPLLSWSFRCFDVSAKN